MPELLLRIDEPNRSICQRILEDNVLLFQSAPGSSHNHQAWSGGYWDHAVEVMNLAILLYEPLNIRRPLPFSLSSALLVMFLHDIEKPWRYTLNEAGELAVRADITTKAERKAFRDAKLLEYGVALSPDEANALQYVEGELDDYSPHKRMQGPLAAFCHACDNTSARMWHDYPLPANDPWVGAKRITEGEA